MKLQEQTKTKSGGIQKDDFLAVWRSMKSQQPLKPRPVPYKHEGSTIDEDGIRVTGTLEFIEAVISRLSDLLKFENSEATRLQISCSELTDKDTGRRIEGRFRCSIQVHERGVGGLGLLERMKRQKMAELYA